MRKFWLIPLLILSACAGIEANRQQAEQAGQGDPIATLLAFTAGDLTVALADAQANNDTIAIPCWAKLLEKVKTLGDKSATVGQVAGAFSAFQKKRDILNNPNSQSIQNDLTIACAPLVMDERQTILAIAAKVGIRGGAAALTGGIALP